MHQNALVRRVNALRNPFRNIPWAARIAAMASEPFAVRRRALPLFWQIFLPNAAVLMIAVAVLAFSPATVSTRISVGQALALAGGMAAMVLINLLLIRRAVRPVEQLTRVMSQVDPLHPGKRLPDIGGSAETAKLTEVFNEMIQRLEYERRESARLMLSAQEQERLRLARELHDEIGQSLAGLMLEIDHAAGQTPGGLSRELREIQERIRALSDELREIVRGLRPEALDDLGLHSALVTLTKGFSQTSGIAIHRCIGPVEGRLSADAELAIYRIGQESLTNIARHAGATEAWFDLTTTGGSVVLRVADNGRGLNGDVGSRGNGIRGMRERAMLIGARLGISDAREGGLLVQLEVPVEA
jgi:two-component system sensor histidine kinase UhpB